jgi:hypothetical protein
MRRTVTQGRWTYTISPDVDLPRGALPSAIVAARLVDELTGSPPRGPVRVSCDSPALTPRVAEDGLVGLAAVPYLAFPQLAVETYTITLGIEADGYVPVRRSVTLGPQAGFPDSFALLELGRVDLHREPVAIVGTVTAGAPGATPAPNAAVRVTGIWRTPPPANVAMPASTPNVVSLRPRIYFDRSAAGGGCLRRREMISVGGDTRVLLEDAVAGSSSLRVSNCLGVAPGGILLVGAGVPDLAEYMTVQSVAGASTPDQTATIVLTYALRNRHPAGAVVQRVTPQAPGADNPFEADAAAGDACALLASMSGLAAAQVIEILGGAPPSEYHLLSRFETLSDAAGHYRLPPLSRVAQLEIQADDGVHPPSTQAVSPEYGLVENLVDFSIV